MARIPTAPPAARFPASPGKSAFPWIFTAVFVASVAFSLRQAQVDPRILFDGQAGANVAKFVAGMFPPQLSRDFLALMLRPAVETLQLSVMGTVIAVVIGMPLGLLATSSLSWSGVLHERASRRGRWLLGFVPYALSRAVLSVFRAVPEYVWAFMFVRAVGLGPFPGVLAIGVAYGGMLGKVYSENLHAAGASRAAIVLYGLVPQALPNVIAYTLYRWECAIRASAVLGFVGAGGLGQQIELSMRMFQFDEVLTLLGILFLLVAGVDFISGRIRAWVT
jgi:phosphonate transport system permease protein